MRLDYVARPAGTKPAAVYWRRRFVAFGVLLLFVWFAAKACGGSGSSPSQASAASQSAKPQPTAPASSTASAPANAAAPRAAAVGTPGATASGSAAQASAPPVTSMCDGSSLSLRAAVDRLSFHRPFTAGITLQIATRSPSPCGLDAGALSAQVLDGSRVLWSSGGCPDAGGAATSDGASTAANTAANTAATGAAGGAGGQSVITVPSQSAADQHYTWRGNVCAGQLAPGRYDVVGRLGLAQAFAGTVTVS